jgi:hypothetical protein
MKKIKFLFLLGSLTICLASYGQASSERIILGKEYAESELKATLKDGKSNNFVDDKRVIIKDSATTVAVVEPILFGIYGKDNIVKEKPYEIYHIDDYWVLSGTLPKVRKGGTFLIILDARNCRVLKIIHGK